MKARHQPNWSVLSPEPAAAQGLVTAVLLCGQLATRNTGLDLWDLRRWLAGVGQNIKPYVLPDLCHFPKAIAPAVRGADRVVLAVCSSDFAEPEARQQVQQAGLDPLTVAFINLGTFATLSPHQAQATQKARVLLAGAIARAQSSPKVTPAHRRPMLAPLGQKVSRRALFTLPPLRYQAVATTPSEGCLADTGCDLCIRACPRNALTSGGGRVRVAKDRCDGCGVCLAVCPTGAMELAGSGPREVEAQIAALLRSASEGLAKGQVAFLCPQAVHAVEAAGATGLGASPGVLPVEVPCAGAVPPGLLLQIVAQGSQSCLVSCPKPCPFGQMEAIQERVDFCQKLLAHLGQSPDGVCFLDSRLPPVNGRLTLGPDTTLEPGKPVKPTNDFRFGMKGLAEAVLALSPEAGWDQKAVFKHPASPFGLVALDSSVCTGCAACAEACPTGAMKQETEEETTAISFDARSCIACSRCMEACPETASRAIHLVRGIDPVRLAQGRIRLFENSVVRCQACGQPVASAAMINKLKALLGEDGGALAAFLGQYCTDCKAKG